MLDTNEISMNERERLCCLVEQWNENRLDLFSLSYPTQDLEIHGVIRFYFQDSNEKVSTKCIRVSSTATTRAVINALVDKFHPDLKMLSDPEYSIWEVHENGEERRLELDEKPLLVQLNWNKDDREGRFVLKKQTPNMPFAPLQNTTESDTLKRGSKRFSKREKKELKKKHQRALAAAEQVVPESIYKALPPTTFTRTISNPEIVMKKRRERKLEAKLKEMGQGGSLKIYGYELVPSRPYVTLLVSVRDRASKIVKETLEKYGLEKENVEDYMLVEVTLSKSDKFSRSLSDLRSLDEMGSERPLDNDECPLINLANHSAEFCGEIIYAIRRRRNRKYGPSTQQCSSSAAFCSRQNSVTSNLLNTTSGSMISSINSVAYANPKQLGQCVNVNRYQTNVATSPYLVAISGGIEYSSGQVVPIQGSLLGIGSDRTMQICLPGEQIRPRHAAITLVDGFVTITPSVSNADIEVFTSFNL
uniref:Afadin n=1 Tax=Syphacia muris TaxID=451379 RepID=A0A0N5AHS9_9BILA